MWANIHRALRCGNSLPFVAEKMNNMLIAPMLF
jgi:hypothetical protein